jgi:hypothetical protein
MSPHTTRGRRPRQTATTSHAATNCVNTLPRQRVSTDMTTTTTTTTTVTLTTRRAQSSSERASGGSRRVSSPRCVFLFFFIHLYVLIEPSRHVDTSHTPTMATGARDSSRAPFFSLFLTPCHTIPLRRQLGLEIRLGPLFLVY